MRPESQLPDFLVIGTAKAGTTSLYRYLKTHPQIYLSPIKEPNYFIFPGTRPVIAGPHRRRLVVWKTKEYCRLFQARADEFAAGEMSLQYLYHESSPGAIRKLIPQAKLIAILRDPADRAHSHFCQNVRDGFEPISDFSAALAAEEQRIARAWWSSFHYRNRGYYARQLRRYLELFPREQMLILLYDDMVTDCPGALRRICEFLGVDPNFAFDTSQRDNVTYGIPRSRLLRSVLRSAGRVKSAIRSVYPSVTDSGLFHGVSSVILNPKPVMQPEVRARLVTEFKPDILELQEIVGRDLSTWLRC